MFVLFGDDVPDAERGGDGRAAHRRPRRSSTSGWRRSGSILLLLTGVGAAARVAQIDADRTCAISSCGRVAAAGRRRRGDGARHSRCGSSGLCFALCAFVVGTIVQEFWRGANVRRQEHRHRHA